MGLDYKILTDDAKTVDLLEDKTHQKIAEHLYELITDEETPGLTIGIEGKWGSGKSTIIGVLNEKLKNLSDTFVFYIDTWAHEGDHLRRVFLEKFIDAIKNKIGQDDEKKLSKSDLEDLKKLKEIENSVCNRTITKTITNTTKINKLGTILSILTIIFLPIGIVFIDNSCSDVTLLGTEPNWLFIIGIGLSLLSVIVGGVAWIVQKIRKKDNPIFWTTESTDNTTDETTQESEKSSVEFDKFFKKLLVFLENKGFKNIICVIDNLDRINEDDALKIWSTLQIFIQEKNPILPKQENKQKLWILVPYDESGLKKLWDKNRETEDFIAKNFLNKSFQLRIDVPQQVLSSWESYAKSEIDIALKNLGEKDKNTVLNVLRWTRKDLSDVPSPRVIKTYINQIAFMYPLCKDNTSLTALCYYVSLKYIEGKSTDDITKELLEKKIPNNSMDLYSGKNNLPQELSAIIFNVDKKKGMQLLLQTPIQNALNNNSADLISLRDNHKEAFYTVLEYVLKSMKEPSISVAIETLYEAFNQSDETGFNILRSYINIESVKNNILTNFQTLSAKALAITLSIKKDDNIFITTFNKNASEKLPTELLKEKESERPIFDKLDSIITTLGDKCSLDLNYSELKFDGLEKLVRYGKEKSVDISGYVKNMTTIDDDIASKIDGNNIFLEIIPDVIASISSKVKSLDKTLDKVKTTLTTGNNLQVQNIMTCLKCLESLQKVESINDNSIKSILKTPIYWHYVYQARNSDSYKIAAFLLLKYFDPITNFAPNGTIGNSQTGLNEVRNTILNKNEDLGKYFYRLCKDIGDYELIWNLAKNHNYKTIGVVIEAAIIDKNRDFFRFTNPYGLLSYGLELVDESKKTDLVKCFIEFDDLIEDSDSDEALILLGNKKTTFAILNQTNDKKFYSKLATELEKVTKSQWTDYFNKNDDIFNIIVYLAESGSELNLANDYCDSFKEYYLSKINIPDPLLAKHELLYKIMKKPFREDFSVGITNKLFEFDFEVETSHHEFLKKNLSSQILFREKKNEFSEKIKNYISQKNLVKLNFIISIIDNSNAKFIPDERYSEILKNPIDGLSDETIKQKLIKIFNVKSTEEV